MTDKQYERAKIIRENIHNLECLQKEVKKNVHVSITLTAIEVLREPLAKLIDEIIDELKTEYESL
jgi:hypothetical protein